MAVCSGTPHQPPLTPSISKLPPLDTGHVNDNGRAWLQPSLMSDVTAAIGQLQCSVMFTDIMTTWMHDIIHVNSNLNLIFPLN